VCDLSRESSRAGVGQPELYEAQPLSPPAVAVVLVGRAVVVQESGRAETLANCQIIFICSSEAGRLGEILPKLGSKPVLTVSEIPGFASRGGVINFYREGSKVRFEINPDAAGEKNLKIGSELLTLGKIVHPEATSK